MLSYRQGFRFFPAGHLLQRFLVLSRVWLPLEVHSFSLSIILTRWLIILSMFHFLKWWLRIIKTIFFPFLLLLVMKGGRRFAILVDRGFWHFVKYCCLLQVVFELCKQPWISLALNCYNFMLYWLSMLFTWLDSFGIIDIMVICQWVLLNELIWDIYTSIVLVIQELLFSQKDFGLAGFLVIFLHILPYQVSVVSSLVQKPSPLMLSDAKISVEQLT